jgi:hypothetical protein
MKRNLLKNSMSAWPVAAMASCSCICRQGSVAAYVIGADKSSTENLALLFNLKCLLLTLDYFLRLFRQPPAFVSFETHRNRNGHHDFGPLPGLTLPSQVSKPLSQPSWELSQLLRLKLEGPGQPFVQQWKLPLPGRLIMVSLLS